MANKIEKPFTFMAPKEYLDTSGTDLKEIQSVYKGADTIWITVDADTGKNPEFSSEGDLDPLPDVGNRIHILLSAENPNHIILMDVLAGSRGHPHNEGWITETLNEPGDVPDNPEWVFTYKTYADHDASHAYEKSEITVTRDGLVSYPVWKQPFITSWEYASERIKMDISYCEDKLKDPLVMEIPSLKGRYTRYKSLLKYIQDNFVDKVPIWKVEIPLIDQV